MTRTPAVVTTPEPAPGEIDRMIGELEASWRSTACFGSIEGRLKPAPTYFGRRHRPEAAPLRTVLPAEAGSHSEAP